VENECAGHTLLHAYRLTTSKCPHLSLLHLHKLDSSRLDNLNILCREWINDIVTVKQFFYSKLLEGICEELHGEYTEEWLQTNALMLCISKEEYHHRSAEKERYDKKNKHGLYIKETLVNEAENALCIPWNETSSFYSCNGAMSHVMVTDNEREGSSFLDAFIHSNNEEDISISSSGIDSFQQQLELIDIGCLSPGRSTEKGVDSNRK
jgi:hypothetical protein